MPTPSTLPDLLRTERAAEQEIAVFEAKGEYRRRTVRDLEAAALRRLGALQRAGLEVGHEVVMPLEDVAAFMEVFWACQLGGFVVMPLSPPAGDASCAKILDVLERRAGACLAIDDAGADRLAAFGGDVADRRVVIESAAGDAPGTPVERAPGDIAFVQYSSGSTRAPKGVIVRHGQALANLAAIAAGTDAGPDDLSFSWMPLSHDMGLVGFHLAPLFSGSHQAVLPTSAFARTPLVWLEDAARLGATVLSSPNFGYRHYLKAAERKGIADDLDLSRVRLILNGAEPISVDLATEFLDRLAAHGLARTTMFPVYGLAEATLAVTFPRIGDEIHGLRVARSSLGVGDEVRVTDDESDSFVTCGCGRALPGMEVRIAGEDGGSVAEGRVGRVWIRGESVTEGYHDDPEATAAALVGEGWLDTGDLGFLQGGELYVTGRRKDLVIMDGQNFYAHDLEDSLATALELDPIRIAVAPVRGARGAEEVGVFVHHRGEPTDFAGRATEIRAHLSQAFGIGVDLVVPVAQIPRTTSGKVQRSKLADSLARGEFDDVLRALDPDRGVVTPQAAPADAASPPSADDASPEAMEAMMVRYCDDVLGGMRFGPTDNLFEQGMSSIDLAEIHGLIEARYPKGLDIRDFFDSPTIRGLAEILSERVRSGATVQA